MFDTKMLLERPWLMEPGALRRAAAILQKHTSCPTWREVGSAHQERRAEAQAAASKSIRSAKGKVGVIPVHGPIDQRTSSALLKTGGTSTEEIGFALDSLLADATVEAIVLHVDSGGGGSYGVEEVAEKIYSARGKKRIYSAIDSLGASAALWIALAAETVVITPGGDAGSVGVYTVHEDHSAELEKEGVKLSVIQAGKYKTEMAPFAPLSDEAKAHLQEVVDATYNKFVRALARQRGLTASQVQKDFGQGRLLQADAALEARMVDKVMSFEALMDKLTGTASQEQSKKASVEMLRMRQAHRRLLEKES